MPCHPPLPLRFRFVAAMDELNTMFKILSNKMFKHDVWIDVPELHRRKKATRRWLDEGAGRWPKMEASFPKADLSAR